MSILIKVKAVIANLYLQYKLNRLTRNTKPANRFNFKNVKTIAILFDATEKLDFELMKKYVNYLREHGKKVKVVGFYNSKTVPEHVYSKLEYDFYSTKDLSFIGEPKPLFINSFLAEEFDLMVDLNLKNHFSLKYISFLSNAKFKVGAYNAKYTDNYELMIDIEKNNTLKYFLRQIDIYVPMFNKEN